MGGPCQTGLKHLQDPGLMNRPSWGTLGTSLLGYSFPWRVQELGLGVDQAGQCYSTQQHACRLGFGGGSYWARLQHMLVLMRARIVASKLGKAAMVTSEYQDRESAISGCATAPICTHKIQG